MESALIVSPSEKETAFFTELLNEASIHRIASQKSVDGARRIIQKQDFDLVIVNAPLPDESGEIFSRQIALKNTSQVMLFVKSVIF